LCSRLQGNTTGRNQQSARFPPFHPRQKTRSSPERYGALSVFVTMSISVLVVEDEFLIRVDVVEHSKHTGFEVYEASNASQAIAEMEAHTDIRAVFTDIHMPGSMDGLKLAHYVRGRWPPVKLILTSGRLKPRAEDMPVESVFIAKPYQLEKVAGSLRAIIGSPA
jgi:two-component system, response regulator PdtaR